MNNHETDDNQGIIGVISERLLNGILKENPTFVLLLGMCPTLAVTSSAVNGLGMGVTTMVVLTLSNLIISSLRKVIPGKIRIPAFIVIIASFVTIVELLLKAYIPSLYNDLGLYIPLIVVNCIILGRAESYAYSHPVVPSLFDGLGMGMGFSIALTIIGAIRELLGAGTVFGRYIMPDGFVPVSIFIMAPGAFFVLALLTAIQNKVKEIGLKKGVDVSAIQSGCGGNCLECDKDCKTDLPKSIASDETKEESSVKASKESEEESVLRTTEQNTKKEKDRKSSLKQIRADKLLKKAKNSKEDETVLTQEAVIETDKTEENATKEVTLNYLEEHFETAAETSDKDYEIPDSVHTEDIALADVSKEASAEVFTDESDASSEPGVDSDLELLDLNDYRDALKKGQPSGKKPQRKKGSRAKAQAILFGAEETVEEDRDND